MAVIVGGGACGGEFVTGPSVCVAEDGGVGIFTTADVVGMEAGLGDGAGTDGWVVGVGTMVLHQTFAK